MKKLISLAVLAVVALGFDAPAFATTVSTTPVTVSASVSSALTITANLFKDSANGPTGPALQAMNFGQLQIFTNTATNGQTLRSSNTGTGAIQGGVVALVSANSQTLPYTLSQTGTAMGTLPTGACTVVPFYATADNAGAAMPAGAALGTKGSFVGTRTLYTSEAGAAAIRVIQAHYSITDDPAAGATAAVPINQPGGSYSGTITFTVTA